jgi:hypothetical protein
MRIAEYGDETHCRSRNSIDFGSPRPNAGEGPGGRGASTQLIDPAGLQNLIQCWVPRADPIYRIPPHPQPLIGTNETEVDRKSGVSGSSSLSFFFAPFVFLCGGCGLCGKPWPQTSLGSTVRVTTATSGYEYPTPTVRRFGRDFRTGPLLEVQRILRGCPSRTHYKGFAAPSPRVVDTSIREETHEFRP